MLKYFDRTLIVIYEQGENDGPGRGRGGGEAGGAGQDQCLRLRHVLPGTGGFTILDFHVMSGGLTFITTFLSYIDKTNVFAYVMSCLVASSFCIFLTLTFIATFTNIFAYRPIDVMSCLVAALFCIFTFINVTSCLIAPFFSQLTS